MNFKLEADQPPTSFLGPAADLEPEAVLSAMRTLPLPGASALDSERAEKVKDACPSVCARRMLLGGCDGDQR